MNTHRLSQLPIDEVNEQIQEIYRSQETHNGFISPALKILARRQEYVDLYLTAFKALDRPDSAITPAERYLIMARLAVANHSPYATQQLRIWNEAVHAMSVDKFEAVLRPHEGSQIFSDREHLVMELADRVASGLIDDAFWAQLKAEFSETDLLDLIVIASVEAMFATFTRAVGLTSLDMPSVLDSDLA